MEQRISQFFGQYLEALYFPEVSITDVLEIIIIAFLVYQIMVWIKNTKAWMLLRGIVVLAVFILIAALLQMHTILWIAKNSAAVMATAAIVVFQPELRRGLEKLGEKQMISSMMPFDSKEKCRFSDETVEGIIRAAFQMSKVKTGALIVVEQVIQLTEYESTGIQLDCLVSSQVLINIFEHNTPLHDGAIIVRNDRIVAATCYLPLSDNMGLSKDLGTRHRAAVGMSEVSDALIIVVSEETGKVSVAQGGQLIRGITEEELRERFDAIQNRKSSSRRFIAKWKGRLKDEKKS
ncbi:MAG: diadenylate cyclase CdaA [Eubacteriales bacterium]|nr:diadenylate cyclase CdaA [Eubacteriales bacterium]